jgi:sugar-specific transcriptional regulator TrmB
MSRYLKVLCQELIGEQGEDDTMKREDILRTLAGCGLNEYESRTYSSLVFMGTAKASTISKDSNVPQSKIYDVLESLMGKQLVEVFDGRPKEFKAVEPEFALKKLLDERNREITDLSLKVDRIAEFLKPMAKEETVNGVWTVKGRKWVEFFDKVVDMANRSKKYVYGVTRDYSRSSKLADAIKKCSKRGVEVRVIGLEDVTGENYYKAKWYHENGARLRVYATKVHPRIALIDGKEVLLRLDYDPSKKSNFKFSSLWSADPALVKVFDIYVKNLWKNSKHVSFRHPLPE